VPEARGPTIERERLLVERMLLALPPDHPRARPGRRVRLAGLAGAPWGAGAVGGHAALVVRACNLLGGFQPDVRHQSDDLLVLRALVAAGHALTFLPELLAARGDGGVVLRRIAEADLQREVFLAARRDALGRPALAVVRDAIAGAARGLAAR
jgi:DNA-binding transcriptional LysR family regulator